VIAALEKLWWREEEPALAEAWLWPLSALSLGYRIGNSANAALRKPWRAPVPVISVGNLAVGGAGKTPVALLLCEELRRRGRRPALLSRGYGAKAREAVTWVCRAGGPLLDATAAGDEPLLCAWRAPWLFVLAGSSRRLLALAACEAGADVLVLDDGLQHHALFRDLDVIVADAKNPLGNGRRLPRGPLREGPEALQRVGPRGLLWLTGVGGAPSAQTARLIALAARAGLAGPVRSGFVTAGPEALQLRGARAVLLSGIARPERFHEQVRALGAEVRGTLAYGDHHWFSDAELAAARALAHREGARLVTTEKDAARLGPDLQGLGALVLRGEAKVRSGGELLAAALDRLLAPTGVAPPAGRGTVR
jgi:tetraacyldisaccharide 4'-kinase